MFSNKWLPVFLLALLCTIAQLRVGASPLQHLPDIDTSYADNIMGRISGPNFESPSVEDFQSDDIESTMIREVTSEQVSPVVTSLLGSMSTALAPLLGPLAPLANVIGPMINPSLTGMVTNTINGLLGAANRSTLGQINGYNSYVINIPDQGSFLLLTRHSLQAPAPTPSYNSMQSNIVNAVGAIANEQAAANIFGDALNVPNVAATPVTNTLLDNMKNVGTSGNNPIRSPGSMMPKHKVNKKKQQAFLVPLNLVHAAHGNLNTFGRSRSSNPLTDFQLDVY